ncbi:hypothetical protein ACWDRZ_04555, partial [Streptomyces sp. NPDC003509]
MNTNDPVATSDGQQRDPTTAPGGASYRVRRSYGPPMSVETLVKAMPGWLRQGLDAHVTVDGRHRVM